MSADWWKRREQAAEIEARLRELYDEADVWRWLDSPQAVFGGRVPAEMISLGREAEVLRFLRKITERVHL